LDPEVTTAYGARGVCRAEAGDLDGALADADKAIALGRRDAFTYYIRGLIRAERGDKAEARSDLRTAIDLAPSPAFADNIRSVLTEYGLE
jgi:Flp pilus assembly protein TadD